MKGDKLQTGLADIFPAENKRSGKTSTFQTWSPNSLVLFLKLAKSWVSKAINIIPHVCSWPHYKKSVLCKTRVRLELKWMENKSSLIHYLTVKFYQIETDRVCLWPGIISYFCWCLLTEYRFHTLKLQSPKDSKTELEFQMQKTRWSFTARLRFASQWTSPKHCISGLTDCKAGKPHKRGVQTAAAEKLRKDPVS